MLNQKHPEANEPPQEEGVGEVLRKIAGKTVMFLLKSDVLQAAGSLQLCGGKVVGSEAMIHIFNDDNTVGILLIDVEDGFNSINWKIILQLEIHMPSPDSPVIAI